MDQFSMVYPPFLEIVTSVRSNRYAIKVARSLTGQKPRKNSAHQQKVHFFGDSKFQAKRDTCAVTSTYLVCLLQTTTGMLGWWQHPMLGAETFSPVAASDVSGFSIARR
jgi:hypothetical protein